MQVSSHPEFELHGLHALLLVHLHAQLPRGFSILCRCDHGLREAESTDQTICSHNAQQIKALFAGPVRKQPVIQHVSQSAGEIFLNAQIDRGAAASWSGTALRLGAAVSLQSTAEGMK